MAAAVSDIRVRNVVPRMGEVWRTRIGMIGLASGLGAEDEMNAVLPADALLVPTRVLNRDEISLDCLAEMEADLERAAGTLVPEEALDVVAYCCTSGTIAMGESAVRDAVWRTRPGVPVTNPFTAALAAFAALGVARVTMLAPYLVHVTEAMRAAFLARGVDVVHATTYDLARDAEICQVAPETIFETALEQERDGAQAFFVSCTGLRVVGLIEAIEAAVGIPVVTSNQALAWHALSLAGHAGTVDGFGQLMRLRAPGPG